MKRLLSVLCMFVFVAGLAIAQETPAPTTTDSKTEKKEVKAEKKEVKVEKKKDKAEKAKKIKKGKKAKK